MLTNYPLLKNMQRQVNGCIYTHYDRVKTPFNLVKSVISGNDKRPYFLINNYFIIHNIIIIQSNYNYKM